MRIPGPTPDHLNHYVWGRNPKSAFSPGPLRPTLTCRHQLLQGFQGFERGPRTKPAALPAALGAQTRRAGGLGPPLRRLRNGTQGSGARTFENFFTNKYLKASPLM